MSTTMCFLLRKDNPCFLPLFPDDLIISNPSSLLWFCFEASIFLFLLSLFHTDTISNPFHALYPPLLSPCGFPLPRCLPTLRLCTWFVWLRGNMDGEFNNPFKAISSQLEWWVLIWFWGASTCKCLDCSHSLSPPLTLFAVWRWDASTAAVSSLWSVLVVGLDVWFTPRSVC